MLALIGNSFNGKLMLPALSSLNLPHSSFPSMNNVIKTGELRHTMIPTYNAPKSFLPPYEVQNEGKW